MAHIISRRTVRVQRPSDSRVCFVFLSDSEGNWLIDKLEWLEDQYDRHRFYFASSASLLASASVIDDNIKIVSHTVSFLFITFLHLFDSLIIKYFRQSRSFLLIKSTSRALREQFMRHKIIIFVWLELSCKICAYRLLTDWYFTQLSLLIGIYAHILCMLTNLNPLDDSGTMGGHFAWFAGRQQVSLHKTQ
jgi:hypothetical protein